MKQASVQTRKNRGQGAEIWHRLTKNKTAMAALIFIILLALAVIFAKYLTPYDYQTVDLANALQFPSLKHPLGTDQYGRDLLTRLLYGGRVSLFIALITVAGSIVVAGMIGVAAGYFGGHLDNFLMRCMDVLMAIPGTLMAITIASALGGGIVNTAIAIGIGHVGGLARIFRSSALLLREQEYIEAAEAFGSGSGRIIRKHILPNILAPVIVQCTLKIGESILSIAALRRRHRNGVPSSTAAEI